MQIDCYRWVMGTEQLTPSLPPPEEGPSITALYGSLRYDGPVVSLSDMDVAITQAASEITHDSITPVASNTQISEAVL